jgi:hypothetical protein
VRSAPAALSLAAFAVLASACTAPETASCPGTRLADLRLEGTLVLNGDARVDALDPVKDLPDCTPDASALIQFKEALPPFDARLSAGPEADAAALCRTNGSIYAGTRSGASYAVEAAAEGAVVCNSACAVTLRVVVKGDLAVDADGAPTAFSGALFEVLTEEGGACDACLPVVPASNPPSRACAARYALSGAPY